jgi:hypothetical protein
MLLTILACVGLGLAWAYEADYFAMAFAVAAAFAGGRGSSTIPVIHGLAPASSNQPMP